MNREKYNAIDVANYIVNKSIEMDAPVSHLKLQKLLYYVQAMKLVKTGVPMFDDEISAWKYGPVVESVYHRFKVFANAPISEKITFRGVDYIKEFSSNEIYDPYDVIDLEDQKIIDTVINAYKDVGAMDMVRKTHREAPWSDARDNNESFITIDAIQAYYKEDDSKLLG